MRLARFLAVLLFFGITFAQTCLEDLRGKLTDAELSQSASGLEAAELLKRAVDLLEPVLPQLFSLPSDFAVLPDEAGYPTAKFLNERGLIERDWRPEAFSVEVWEHMLNAFRDWYQLSPATVAGLTRADLVEALNEVIVTVSPKLKPVALVASDSVDRDRVAFWAIIRNDSVYPRMIVFRPPTDAVGLGQDITVALPLLANCAMQPQNYIFAPVDTARDLFLSHNQSRMYVVGTAPEPLEGYTEVLEGEETDYLTFASEETSPFELFSVVFAGPGAGPMTVLRLLPQVRTNMSPAEVLDFVLGN
jgi:hypothetical protein